MSGMDAFVVQTAAEIDQLVADDFDDEQRIAEKIEEFASRPNTAALQRPCTASVPARLTQQPSVLDCLANISTKDSESEESFYARIIQTARQQQQQPPTDQSKSDKRTSANNTQRRKSSKSISQPAVDGASADQKRPSAADVYVLPSRTHSPPQNNSRPSTSSSASSVGLSSASRVSFTSTSSTSATPRFDQFDDVSDERHRRRSSVAGSPSTVNVAQLSGLESGVWYVEQSQVPSAMTPSDRPFSRRTSIRSRFPAINK